MIKTDVTVFEPKSCSPFPSTQRLRRRETDIEWYDVREGGYYHDWLYSGFEIRVGRGFRVVQSDLLLFRCPVRVTPYTRSNGFSFGSI